MVAQRDCLALPQVYVRSVHSRLARWTVVALLVTVTGSHWILLQTAAWVQMTIDYSQTDRLAVALKKTFDGKHPCDLCRLISNEKSSEQKKTVVKFETKLDLMLDTKPLCLYPPPFPKASTISAELVSWSESPAKPPPRFLHG
jgi:hypothetical protein